MYTTQNNRKIERQFDREAGVVARVRYIQHGTIDKQIVRQIDRQGGQIVRCIQHRSIDRQRERQIDREEDEVATDRQMYTTQNNRQIERQLDREEEEEDTDRKMYTTQNNRQRDSLIERRGWQLEIDVYNIEQQIDREIDRQGGEERS